MDQVPRLVVWVHNGTFLFLRIAFIYLGIASISISSMPWGRMVGIRWRGVVVSRLASYVSMVPSQSSYAADVQSALHTHCLAGTSP